MAGQTKKSLNGMYLKEIGPIAVNMYSEFKAGMSSRGTDQSFLPGVFRTNKSLSVIQTPRKPL